MVMAIALRVHVRRGTNLLARPASVKLWDDGGRDAVDVAFAVRVVEEQETAHSAVGVANEPVEPLRGPQGVQRRDANGSGFSRRNRVGGVQAQPLRSDH